MVDEFGCDECPLDKCSCGLDINGCDLFHQLIGELENKKKLLFICSRQYQKMVEYAIELEDHLKAVNEWYMYADFMDLDNALKQLYQILHEATGGSVKTTIIGGKFYTDRDAFLRYYHAVCKALNVLEKKIWTKHNIITKLKVLRTPFDKFPLMQLITDQTHLWCSMNRLIGDHFGSEWMEGSR